MVGVRVRVGLPHKQFNVLAIYTGINDDYILSNPTAMANSVD